MPLFFGKFYFPLPVYPYLGTGPWPVKVCPITTTPQHRWVCPHRNDNMIWRIVGKISLAVDQYSSQGRVHCTPANARKENIRPRMFNSCEGVRFLIQIQQSFEIACRNALRPAERHKQSSVFCAVRSHWPQCRLCSPILSIGGIDQFITNVIIKSLNLLANSAFTLREYARKLSNLWINRFDVQFGLEKGIQQFPLAS